MNKIYFKVKNKDQFLKACGCEMADAIICEFEIIKDLMTEKFDFYISKKEIYVALPDVIRESECENIKAMIKFAEEYNISGIFINNIDAAGLLLQSEYKNKVLCGEMLYCYNKESIKNIEAWFKDVSFISPPELTIKEMKDIESDAGIRFIYKIYGYQHLLTTAQKTDNFFEVSNEEERNHGAEMFNLEDHFEVIKEARRFKKKKGDRFYALGDKNGYSMIYNGIPTYMFDKLFEFDDKDIRQNKSTEITEKSDADYLLEFNIETVTQMNKITEELKKALNSNSILNETILQDNMDDHFKGDRSDITRGHYHKGIE